MSRATENKSVNFDPTTHIYKGDLIPQFKIPTYKLATVDNNTYPTSERVIFTPNIDLLKLPRTSAGELSSLLTTTINASLDIIASQIARHYHEYNWVGVSFGINWGDTPIHELRRILASKRLTHDSSVAQIGGERNKRITHQGFYISSKNDENNFWKSF